MQGDTATRIWRSIVFIAVLAVVGITAFLALFADTTSSDRLLRFGAGFGYFALGAGMAAFVLGMQFTNRRAVGKFLNALCLVFMMPAVVGVVLGVLIAVSEPNQLCELPYLTMGILLTGHIVRERNRRKYLIPTNRSSTTS